MAYKRRTITKGNRRTTFTSGDKKTIVSTSITSGKGGSRVTTTTAQKVGGGSVTTQTTNINGYIKRKVISNTAKKTRRKNTSSTNNFGDAGTALFLILAVCAIYAVVMHWKIILYGLIAIGVFYYYAQKEKEQEIVEEQPKASAEMPPPKPVVERVAETARPVEHNVVQVSTAHQELSDRLNKLGYVIQAKIDKDGKETK